MKLRIKNIILYPQDKDLMPRFITFNLNKVNVITGYSKRGKSAIIPIIDYCLGSKECNIPIGLIREKVDKFALYLELDGYNVFIALDCPTGAQTSDIMYFQRIDYKDEYPCFNTNQWIQSAKEFETNKEFIKHFFSNYVGLKDLSENSDSSQNNGFNAPASFRDMTAFEFQSQNIVANPTTMFYNTETYEHFMRLKTLFPLVLGYKSYEILEIENRIEYLEKQLHSKQNKYDDIASRYNNWQQDVYQYYTAAIKYGLTKSKLDINTASVEDISNELKQIIERTHEGDFWAQGASLQHNMQIDSFEQMRLEVARELDKYRTRLAQINRYEQLKHDYHESVMLKELETLAPIDWFLKKEGENKCPFCHSETDTAVLQLLELKEEKDKLTKLSNSSRSFHADFTKEKNNLRNKIESLENELHKIESNIKILADKNKEHYNNLRQAYVFVGKLDTIIEQIKMLSPSSELMSEINQLVAQIATERQQLTLLKKKFDKESCLAQVSKFIDKYIRFLPIEDGANKTVLLDPDTSANIRIKDNVTHNISFLSKIGSGSNHMCYHIATMLGLHHYFLSLKKPKHNYVPSFLVIDQPSQVYYPESMSDYKQQYSDNDNRYVQRSEDWENTRKIFETCSRFFENTEAQTQIIILEHAPNPTWEGIDNVNEAENWRGSRDENDYEALIPQDWLNK